MLRFRVFVEFLEANTLLLNWGSGFVPVCVEKSGLGFRKSRPGWVLNNPLHTTSLVQSCVQNSLLWKIV